MEEQNNKQNLSRDDQQMKLLVNGFAVFFVVMGILIIWKGVTDAIPIVGFAYGVWFLVAGIFSLVVGIAILAVPPVLKKKKARKETKQ